MADPLPLGANADLASLEIRSPLAQVELYLARIADFPGDVRFDALSPEERERAGRMAHFPRRAEFVSGRTLLRRVLARRLGVSPVDVPLTVDPSGRPTLPEEAELRASLAHSGGLLLAAVARSSVGVDLEAIRQIDSASLIARRFFSRNESRAIASASESLRVGLFFNIWTRREAVAKARGTGLSGFSEFSIHPTLDLPGQWQLEEIEIGRGYAAAVALEI
jgi:4'-phosphopantetheinyl transferase